MMITAIEVEIKVCGKCKASKPISEFYKNAASLDGRQSYCKTCKKVWQQSPIGKKSHGKSEKKWGQSKTGRASSKQKDAKAHSTISGYLKCIFYAMKQRCNDTKHPSYKNYGGRGIRCLFESLNDFRDYVMNVLKVDPRGLQIDRIDNDGNYQKGNIRFVTRLENQQNKRKLCHV